MNDWNLIAARILAAVRAKEAEIVSENLAEEDEEQSILVETLAEALRQEERDGRLHLGPAQD